MGFGIPLWPVGACFGEHRLACNVGLRLSCKVVAKVSGLGLLAPASSVWMLHGASSESLRASLALASVFAERGCGIWSWSICSSTGTWHRSGLGLGLEFSGEGTTVYEGATW